VEHVQPPEYKKTLNNYRSEKFNVLTNILSCFLKNNYNAINIMVGKSLSSNIVNKWCLQNIIIEKKTTKYKLLSLRVHLNFYKHKIS